MLASAIGKDRQMSPRSGASGTAAARGVIDYSAVKNGVISLTKTMAKQLAPHITVNTVAPGHTVTDLTASLPDAVKKGMVDGTYLKRMAQPEDIAKAILVHGLRRCRTSIDRDRCSWWTVDSA